MSKNLPTGSFSSISVFPTFHIQFVSVQSLSRVQLFVTPWTAARQASLSPTPAAALLQLCLTLCDPIDGSPPDFPSLGFSRQEHWSGLPFPSPMHKSESEVVQSCPTVATPWTAAYQAPPSMGFSRQKYWSGVPLPSPLVNSSHSQFLIKVSIP